VGFTPRNPDIINRPSLVRKPFARHLLTVQLAGIPAFLRDEQLFEIKSPISQRVFPALTHRLQQLHRVDCDWNQRPC